jgi:3-methyladenine DNA glycosylase AlkD
MIDRLKEMGNSRIAAHSQRFFKTGKGEYAEGDVFLGIRVPELRRFAREHRNAPIEVTGELLVSPFHEVRLLALFLFVAKYTSGTPEEKEKIYHFYLTHTSHINNWDLVDCSAEHIVGAHLFNRNRKPIYNLAGSKSMWERRIGIMATFHFIKKGQFSDTIAVAGLLLNDREDLIHKATGWMLRETGKRDLKEELVFLNKFYKKMPRTMLRYAIEKFPEAERKAYLNGAR